MCPRCSPDVVRGALADLPAEYWSVPYVGSRYPGNVPRGEFALGANCQLWAFEVLSFFGLSIPDLRSDDLWEDNVSTTLVDDPQPLDLVLCGRSSDPYGAHVGVWTGEATAHLCEEVGYPTTWTPAEFMARPRYASLIGFKRPRATRSS